MTNRSHNEDRKGNTTQRLCGVAWNKISLPHTGQAHIPYNQTPNFAVATGTPGPIVEVTVQLLR